jgi:hypothetical protein
MENNPSERVDSTVRGHLAGPYARTLLLFYAMMSPVFAFCGGLYTFASGRFSLALLVVAVGFGAVLMAGLAWLNISTTAVSVTLRQSGVLVVQRALRPGTRSGVLIPWSEIGPRVVFSRYVGRVGVWTRNPGGVIAVTLSEARAILRDPRCPPCEVPPKLSRSFERMR